MPCAEPASRRPRRFDEQDRGTGRLLHLLDRLVDARRVDAKPGDTDCAGRSGQRDPQNGGDVALLVVADAADAGAFQDGVSCRRRRDDRALEHRGMRGIGERSVGVEHVEPIGEALLAELHGDVCRQAAGPPRCRRCTRPDGKPRVRPLSRPCPPLFWMTPLTILRHRVDRSDDHGAGVLRPDQLLALEQGEREPDAYDDEGQDDEQADPGAQQQRSRLLVPVA